MSIMIISFCTLFSCANYNLLPSQIKHEILIKKPKAALVRQKGSKSFLLDFLNGVGKNHITLCCELKIEFIFHPFKVELEMTRTRRI